MRATVSKKAETKRSLFLQRSVEAARHNMHVRRLKARLKSTQAALEAAQQSYLTERGRAKEQYQLGVRHGSSAVKMRLLNKLRELTMSNDI